MSAVCAWGVVVSMCIGILFHVGLHSKIVPRLRGDMY